MNFYNLEDIDLGSPNLHAIEIFSHRYHLPKKLVILAFIGAELAGGGGQILPPSRAHNSEPHSRARVNPSDVIYGGHQKSPETSSFMG